LFIITVFPFFDSVNNKKVFKKQSLDQFGGIVD